MINIKLSHNFKDWPLARQTPGSRGEWNNCKFYINDKIDKCDYWVVYEGLLSQDKTLCPPGNTILITGEPPSIKTYDERFLNQFATVITAYKEMVHSNKIISQQGLPWMVGGRFLGDRWDQSFSKDYDEIKSIKYYNKSKLMSVICSSKANTKGHAKRLKFIKRLKTHFGNGLDVFGAGINKVEDKWDAIAGYKYHVVIENSSLQDYWTEKLSDAFLGCSYPFYYGCTNLSDYFPDEAYTLIDINDFDKSIAIIDREIKNQKYEGSIERIMEAKDLILDKYNVFALIADYCDSHPSSSVRNDIVLQPEGSFLQNAGRINKFLKMFVTR